MRWEDTVKMNLKDIECEDVKWIELAQDHIGINSIGPSGFAEVIHENGLPGRLP
jgi:hypothetical protein